MDPTKPHYLQKSLKICQKLFDLHKNDRSKYKQYFALYKTFWFFESALILGKGGSFLFIFEWNGWQVLGVSPLSV